MPHYYRKPRDTSLHELSNGALQRALKPFPFAEQGLSALTQPALADLVPKIPVAETAQGANAREAVSLVHSAASILNEDVAAGVLAARDARVGSVMPSSTATRDGMESRQLLRQAHDFVDAIASLLPRLQDGASSMFNSAATAGPSASASDQVTVLRPSAPVRPGEVARLTVKLHNDSANVVKLAVHCGGLLTSSGRCIGADLVSITPREASLGADERVDAVLELRIPHDGEKGRYAGVVMVSGAPDLCAVAIVEVV